MASNSPPPESSLSPPPSSSTTNSTSQGSNPNQKSNAPPPSPAPPSNSISAPQSSASLVLQARPFSTFIFSISTNCSRYFPLVLQAPPLLTKALETEYFENLLTRGWELTSLLVRCSGDEPVRALDSMDELADLNNGMKPGQSGIYDSREHSAQIRMFPRMAFGSQDLSSDFYSHPQSSWKG